MRVSSLAYRAGWRFSLLVSVGVLLSHTLFAYAQYSGKDRDCILGQDGTKSCPDNHLGNGLLKGKVSVHLDYQASGALDDVVRVATEELCYKHDRMEPCPNGQQTSIVPSMAAMDDICTALECGGLSFAESVFDMSYW